jgi:hypothetical protein
MMTTVRQQLECGDAAQLLIARSVDDTHSAAADFGEYLEVAELVAWGKLCIESKVCHVFDAVVEHADFLRVCLEHAAHGGDQIGIIASILSNECIAFVFRQFKGALKERACTLPSLCIGTSFAP